MSESKHTPGPWRTDTDIFHDRLDIRDESGRRIAVCMHDYPMSMARHDANAHLIAAAPDLLDVAEHFCCHRNMDILDGTCVFRCGRIKNGMCQQATDCWILKAIQKAKGENNA